MGRTVAGAFLGLIVLAGLAGPAGPAGPTSPASGGASASPSYPLGHFLVGMLMQTFTDTSRGTAAWGGQPASSSRTLVTTILYPAASSAGSSATPTSAPVASAAPDRSGAPYPLIVFSHGLGASPQDYLPLLESWASAGFVVAAPRFPLTSSATPGGPDAGDVVNQPKDVSDVIGGVVSDSAASTGTLAGLVAPNEVGVAGHSNGAVTTLGLIANTCCHDPRVKAAVVMAGTTVGIPGGTYDYKDTPPVLLVHGTADQLIPYRSAPIVYDAIPGPKGLLTIAGGSHESAAGLVSPSSTHIVRATTDFFDAYLRGETSALSRMRADAHSATTSLVFDPVAGSRGSPVPIPPPPVVHLKASVTPDRNLSDGEAVTVRWSGYTAGKVVNVLECYKVDISAAEASSCSFANAAILHADPTGRGSLVLHVVTGTVGDGTCGPHVQGCAIVVNNSSSTIPSESRILPIEFAASS
jgi:predicted dienelactone hydrolase